MDTWLIIYRSYSAEKLEEEIAWLQTQSRNLFVSQNEGNRAYTRSTREVSDRLAAAIQVKQERGGTVSTAIQADLSNLFNRA